jgi:hypothetical protein
MMTIDEIHALVNQLPRDEQARLIGIIAQDLAKEAVPPPKGQSFRGILKHLGPAPSAEEIDEARREMWAGFGEGDDY